MALYLLDVPPDRLNTAASLRVKEAEATWGDRAVTLRLTLSGMTPALIEIGQVQIPGISKIPGISNLPYA